MAKEMAKAEKVAPKKVVPEKAKAAIPSVAKPVEVAPKSEYLEYKRYSDNRVVKARLVELDDCLYMETLWEGEGDFVCPECHAMLSKNLRHEVRQKTYLEVRDFHAKHRPVENL